MTEYMLSPVDENKSIKELLQVAADYSQRRITLTDSDRQTLIALLKKRAAEELEYGQEIECENVRVIRRVTGAVGVYFT
ncbi:MAG: hypothetical protein HY711_05270 [Candidatus Melainabacteria bacterium]|nr:hypothetical protein [Candidatus Melainabacteria bacterium]